MFYSNILDGRAVLEKKVRDMVDDDFREDFRSAFTRYEDNIKKYTTPRNFTFVEWQQHEGGFASIVLEPFKKEAAKYGFENISREKARMVRWEHFMKYGKYTARTPKDCFENGVNKKVENYLKKEIYNALGVPFNDLRGWCHREHPTGLFMDFKERCKALTPLWINEAIRNEEIRPTDFTVERGKRYEKYYMIEQNSHADTVAQKVANQIIQTKFSLFSGSGSTNKLTTIKSVNQLKQLLNQISNSSVELMIDGNIKQKKTIWKKLQEENDRARLTTKEFNALQKFVRKFFRDEFSFNTFSIAEIL
jgi:hypothetical protein